MVPTAGKWTVTRQLPGGERHASSSSPIVIAEWRSPCGVRCTGMSVRQFHRTPRIGDLDGHLTVWLWHRISVPG